jgi:hypothetical protein
MWSDSLHHPIKLSVANLFMWSVHEELVVDRDASTAVSDALLLCAFLLMYCLAALNGSQYFSWFLTELNLWF